VSPSEFIARKPEFRNAPVELIQAKLDQASRFCHPDTWGDLRDDGVAEYASDLLAGTPEGKDLRLIDKQSGKTVYTLRYEELRGIVGIGGLLV